MTRPKEWCWVKLPPAGGQALRKRVHDSCKWPLNLPSHLVLQANWGTYLGLIMTQRASMSLTMALSFCSVIRSSGSLCEEIRQLWRYCRKAEQHWRIYRKCGFPVARISDSAADLLWHLGQISLFPWMFLFSLVYSCHTARRELHRALCCTAPGSTSSWGLPAHPSH